MNTVIAGLDVSPIIEIDGKDEFTWEEAQGLVERLKRERYDHYDWRLPSKEDWEKIVNDEQFESEFPDDENRYQSSSDYAGYTHLAWSVLFNDGHVCYNHKSSASHVRLVRTSREN